MTDHSTAEPPHRPLELQTGLGRTAWIGSLSSLALLAILVIWAQFTMIGGAVIAQGQVMVRGQPKMVQSLDGGVVAKISVTDGDTVAEGDVLVQLDPTLLQVNLDIARGRLAEAVTQKARLEAEERGLDVVDFNAITTSGAMQYLTGLSLTHQQEGQTELFLARREVLRGGAEQLRERIRQFHNQATGIEGQLTSKQDQLVYVERELANVVALNKDGLARESQVLDIQRSQSELLGQLASHQSELARVANSIRDTELEILQANREFKEKVVTDLRDITTKAEELILQIVTTQKQLDRVDIRAPAKGVVHEMQVSTVGGVIAPGATLLQIVPLSEGVEFDLKLDPKSIDQVFLGQGAKVQFTAFSSRSTPEIHGTVSAISPTSVTDPATGQSFYRLKLQIAPDELAKLGSLELVPGMPMEAFLQTSERSALSYLLKPLTDQLNRAFRDD